MEASPTQPSATSQTGPIVVYGATGYTGKLIAAELADSDLDFQLAGRNREKLEELRRELGVNVPVRAVSTDDAEGLRKVFDPAAAVIACAGPFYLHGGPVLAAAVDTGTHYLDTTGEQPFMKFALDHYGPEAEENGSAVVSGMGFDYVPGDMIAALTAAGMGELDTIRLGYVTNFQMTRGTMLSALEMIKGGDLEWRDGRLQPAPQSVGRGKFDFGDAGEKFMTRYPAGEHVTVPRHVRTRRVETMLSADSIAPGPVARLAPLIARPAGLAMRTHAKNVAERLITRLPEGADPESRSAATFTVGCEAIQGSRIRRGRVTGKDIYGLTAALLVKGAALAATGQIRGKGGLAPSQAFDPETFMDALDRFELKYSVDSLPA